MNQFISSDGLPCQGITTAQRVQVYYFNMLLHISKDLSAH